MANAIEPVEPTSASTRLGEAAPPGPKLTLELWGQVVPPGKTARKPGCWAFKAVTLRTTAETLVEGIPGAPRTVNCSVSEAPRVCIGAPARVSNKRCGAAMVWSTPPVVEGGGEGDVGGVRLPKL